MAPPPRRVRGAHAAAAPRDDRPQRCLVLGSARHQGVALLAAAATDDVRPGLATTGDAGSRGDPDVAGGGRGGRGGAWQPPRTLRLT